MHKKLITMVFFTLPVHNEFIIHWISQNIICLNGCIYACACGTHVNTKPSDAWYYPVSNDMYFWFSGFAIGLSAMRNPGLVADGTKCGTDMICREQRCQSVSCPPGSNDTGCSVSKHGVCRSEFYDIPWSYLTLKFSSLRKWSN